MDNININSDLENLIANTSLEDIIRIKESAILKQQQHLQVQLNELRSLTQGEKKDLQVQLTDIKVNNLSDVNDSPLTVQRKIINAFKTINSKEGLTNKEISEITGLSVEIVRDACSKLKSKGYLKAKRLDSSTMIKTFFIA